MVEIIVSFRFRIDVTAEVFSETAEIPTHGTAVVGSDAFLKILGTRYLVLQGFFDQFPPVNVFKIVSFCL